MFTDNYRVVFEDYSRKHHGQWLSRSYGNRWPVTYKALRAQFARVEQLIMSGHPATSLTCKAPNNTQWIIEHTFKIAGTQSPEEKHRALAYVDREERIVRVLAFYPVVPQATSPKTAIAVPSVVTAVG